MYRLLLPGIAVKRWILVNFTGMLLFALGIALFISPSAIAKLHTALVAMTPQIHYSLALLFMIMGVLFVAQGTRRLLTAFISLANPSITGRQLVHALLEKRQPSPRLKIVGIGGGTGLSTLLRGLKAYPVDLTAIVTVSDDGGSSGRLREDFSMPPPGDFRNCLIALAEAEPLMARIFQHRFSKDAGEMAGHSVGNLIIAGLGEITGDFLLAIQEVSRVLAVRGRVLPSANQALVLTATMDDGRIIAGESAIVAAKGVITSIGIDPAMVAPLPEAVEALRDADVIIVGPGSVYTSLLPNLIIPGMATALAESSAIKFFVCNVMTQPGESDAFSASRHLEVVLDHLPCANPFHYTVVNLQRPPADVMGSYAEKGQHFVEPDLERIRRQGSIPLTGDLLAEAHLARHHSDRLARCIIEKVAAHAHKSRALQRRTTTQ